MTSLSEWACECGTCPCNPERFAPVLRTSRSDTAIVVDHPTALEQAKRYLLAGDTGNLAKQVMKAYGLLPNMVYTTTAVNCRPNTKKEAMMKKAMLGCRDRLVDELKVHGVERVLCLGSVGYSQLANAERVLPVTKVRGRWVEFHGMDIMCTFNPAWLFGEPDYFRDFCRDIEKFCTTDPEPGPDLELWEPESLQEALEAFEFLSDASFVSADVETTGVSAYRDELLAVGFGVLYDDSHDGVSVILHQSILEADETWAEIAFLLNREDQATALHNAKFDLKFFRRHLLERGLPYAPKRIEDTMMLNYCQDERPMGRFQSHSLKNISRVRCDAPDYDIEMGKWLKEWATASPERRAVMRKQMHEYLALDCYYTARIYPDLLQEVIEEDPMLLSHYQNTLMPGVHALVEVEMHGAKINRKYFEEQWIDLQERAAPLLARVREITGLPEFNPNSPKQVAEYLYLPEDQGGQGLPILRTARRGKLQEGKTSKQVLKMLRKKHPEHTEVIDCILGYRNLIKNA